MTVGYTWWNMNLRTKNLLRAVSLHVAMLAGIGLVILGTVLLYGFPAGFIAIGAGMALYSYLLGAD